jgi:hypothetical protein
LNAQQNAPHIVLPSVLGSAWLNVQQSAQRNGQQNTWVKQPWGAGRSARSSAQGSARPNALVKGLVDAPWNVQLNAQGSGRLNARQKGRRSVWQSGLGSRRLSAVQSVRGSVYWSAQLRGQQSAQVTVMVVAWFQPVLCVCAHMSADARMTYAC